jgi:hypothetical protein
MLALCNYLASSNLPTVLSLKFIEIQAIPTLVGTKYSIRTYSGQCGNLRLVLGSFVVEMSAMMDATATMNGVEESKDPLHLKEIGNQYFKKGVFDHAIVYYQKAIRIFS